MLASTAPLLLIFLVQTEGGGWSPGIGDPTLVGWVTVVAYFVAAYLCLRAFRGAQQRTPAVPRVALSWLVLCVGLAFLGVNKQLDLQSLLTVIGRRLARSEGWYEHRGLYQLWFIRGILLAAAVGAATVVWVLQGALRELWLAVLGSVFLAAFVVIRAASFHHVDALLKLGLLGFQGLPLNGILELSGIGCVAVGAARTVRRGAR